MSLKIEEVFNWLGNEITPTVVTEVVPYFCVKGSLRMCH